MRCLICTYKLSITRTKPVPGGVERTRVCKRPTGPHSFTTIERVPTSIAMIGLRRSPGDRLTGAFDGRKLRGDLRDALMMKVPETIGPTTIGSIVRGVEQEVVNTARWHVPLDDAEVARLPTGEEQLRFSVLHRQVVTAVHDQLEAHGFEVHRILYELAVRRSEDHRRAPARDVLAWLSQTFTAARRPIPPGRVATREYSWTPGLPVVPPQSVQKRNGRDTERFNGTKLRESIELSFAGRRARPQQIEQIARWVEASLDGQRRVHSLQLSAAMLDCLRRVDDIAYLRYAIAVKGLASAEVIADEAEDLLTAPSPRLRFPDRREIAAEAGAPLVAGGWESKRT